jgi:S-adenosylmethionine-diacylgycerolhomoserine-N-methlytransferase
MMPDADHGVVMDRVYRHQRHIYDLTRKCYLVGRDRMIAELEPGVGDRVLEIGCGTGRNLYAAADRYPLARFYGIDISLEMLATALKRSQRHVWGQSISFAHADAATFDPWATFGVAAFDRVFISYALSMIPDWRRALDRAAAAVAPGGRLHIVDFGQQEQLPYMVRKGLAGWLALFLVEPREGLQRHCARLAATIGGDLEFRRLYGGYAWSLRLTRPASPASDAAAVLAGSAISPMGADSPGVDWIAGQSMISRLPSKCSTRAVQLSTQSPSLQ